MPPKETPLSTPSGVHPAEPGKARPSLRLSGVQLAASALAAVTAAVAASYLGVNGTVIGAAVASVLSVAGTAVYTHSLERTGHRVRTVVPATARWMPAPATRPDQHAPIESGRRAGRPRMAMRQFAFATVGVFVAALAIVTGVELLAGRPVNDLVTGTAANGTTVFGSQQKSAANSTTPTVTVTVVPKVVVTTPTVTRTATPITTTPTPTAAPTGSPTATPTATAGSGAPTP